MSAPPDDRRLETPAVDFGVLFNASPNPYMVVDRELRFVAANAAYLSTTARRLEDLLGRHILEVFPDDPSNPNNANATRVLESFARVVETGAPDVLAFIPSRVERVRGGVPEERFWSATHTPIKDSEGRVIFVLQHTVDVTELHALTMRGRGNSTSNQTEAGVLDRAQRATETIAVLDEQLRELRRMFAQAPGFMCFLRCPNHVAVEHHGEETGSWDSDRLDQVLGNLIGNAFQHAPAGAPISVSSRVDGDEAMIEIHNDGPAIEPADLARLFEPFRQGHSAQKSIHGRSVGLGLYIARQVIASHGGSLTVRSVEGEGTRFMVRLPRETACSTLAPVVATSS